jgi:hypothetical protein
LAWDLPTKLVDVRILKKSIAPCKVACILQERRRDTSSMGSLRKRPRLGDVFGVTILVRGLQMVMKPPESL